MAEICESVLMMCLTFEDIVRSLERMGDMAKPGWRLTRNRWRGSGGSGGGGDYERCASEARRVSQLRGFK